jgi:PAS domain S-box-containing protein
VSESVIEGLKAENRLLREQIKDVQRRFEYKIAELSMVREIGMVLLHLHNFERGCSSILDVIIQNTIVQNCSIMLLDKETDHLFLIAATNPEKKTYVLDARRALSREGVTYCFKSGEGAAGRAMLAKRPVLIHDVKESSRFMHQSESDVRIGSLLSIPLMVDVEPFGVINLSHTDTHVFEANEVNLFSIIANFVAISLHSMLNYERLQYSETKYRALSENSNDGIAIIEEGRHSYTNPRYQRLLGYTNGDLERIPLAEVLGGSGRGTPMGHIHSLLEGNDSHSQFEAALHARDGDQIPVEINSASILYNGKNALILSVRDLTERKKAEEALRKAHDTLEVRVTERTAALHSANEQLKQEIEERKRAEAAAEAANRAKSDFLANMSHEIRTPLNHIIGFTELIVDKQLGELNADQEEYLGDVLQSGRHLMDLINDILDLSKVEAGRLQLERSEVNLTDLLEGSLVMIKEKSLKHGIQLSAAIETLPEVVRVDEVKIKQILYNLLSNAVKFTPHGGQVSLKARMVEHWVQPGLRRGDSDGVQITAEPAEGTNGKKRRQCVELVVADSGIGIKPEDQERVFARFEQVDGSTSRRFEGTGLGLALTKNLVELHGGIIWVESEGEGKGATFCVALPV